MKSIQSRITNIIIIGILTMSVFIIGSNIILTSSYANYHSRITLNETCNAQALKLDVTFATVERAVRDIFLMTEKERPDLSEFNNTELLKNYIENFRNVAINIADDTEGALAVYYRINPDLSNDGTTGFFWVKSPETGKFEENEITDLFAYDPEDIEHVGWYYIPVRAGKPVWMEPYYNQNIHVEMISYVVPFYVGNRLIGVIGMDIDFSSILDIVDDVDIYSSGSAALFCMSNSLVYHKNTDIFGETIPSELYNQMVAFKDSEKQLIDYTASGRDYKLAFHTLNNSMKLVVYVPTSEINAQRNQIMLYSALIISVLMIVMLLAAVSTTKKITKPIKDITEATQQFALGNWDVSLTCNTNDELAVLTDNILIMADKTKKYIGSINDVAFTDGLTGLKNKSCYLDYINRINKRCEDEADFSYSIAVFDVNYLKYINDNFGHEAGDDLLRNAGKIICNYFSHSPVFRTGGDEFVVLIDGGDRGNCKELLAKLQFEMFTKMQAGDKTAVSIASGIAHFGEDGTDFDTVFQCADKRMYDNKVFLKGGVAPR